MEFEEDVGERELEEERGRNLFLYMCMHVNGKRGREERGN